MWSGAVKERRSHPWAARALRGGIACLLAGDALAVPTPCPVTVGTSYCEVVTGDTDVVVSADADGHNFLLYTWSVGGVSQLYYEGATLRLDTSPTGAQLEDARADPDTGTIVVSYLENGSGIELTTTFAVSDTGSVSEIEETLTVASPSQTASVRLYVVTDFDLAGSTIDDTAHSSPDGISFTQSDGTTTGQVEVTSTPPDAFEVAVCVPASCPLGSIIQQNATFALDDAWAAFGPADLQHALSWDRTLGAGQSFTTVLRKTIRIPEPAASLGGGAAGVSLLALMRWRERSRTEIRLARDGGSCAGTSARRVVCG
jgi:hypothetical protein